MKKLLSNQVISYLFFGVLTTLVYLVVRFITFSLTQQAMLAMLIANLLSILFAFVTNDSLVFRQKRQGWPERLLKFFLARLSTLGLDALMTFIFVTSFPHLIGQLVNHDLKLVNAIVALVSQVLIIVGNYLISKWLVFTTN